MVEALASRGRRASHLVGRLATFARSLLTGGAASLADLAALGLAVGLLGATPAAASVPALLVGAVVQFFGNRHFAFRAGSGSVGRQALLFLATEAVAMVLNGVLYARVAAWIPATVLSALVARVVTTNLVFLLWSYPAWKRVFQPASGPPGIAGRSVIPWMRARRSGASAAGR